MKIRHMQNEEDLVGFNYTKHRKWLKSWNYKVGFSIFIEIEAQLWKYYEVHTWPGKNIINESFILCGR